MPTLLKLLPALALAATVSLAHAQTPVTREEGHMPAKGKKMEPRGMESGVLMKDGKMMQMKDGQLVPMTADMTMSDGTKVTTSGQVMMAGGKSMMLQNGQHVMMDGHVMGKPMPGKMKGKMGGSM